MRRVFEVVIAIGMVIFWTVVCLNYGYAEGEYDGWNRGYKDAHYDMKQVGTCM